MKEGGIGGVEIQPVYPVALDDASNGLQTVPFLSQPFLDRLHVCRGHRAIARPARRSHARQRLAVWRAVGRHRRCRGQAARRARQSASGRSSVVAPDIGAGEPGLPGYLVKPGTTEPIAGAPASRRSPEGRAAVMPSDGQERELLAFIASRTGMMVKRPAIGAEGFVLNHYDRVALDRYLDAVGRPLLSAFPAGSPPHGDLLRQPRGVRQRLDASPARGVPTATRLRSAAAPAGARRRRDARARRRSVTTGDRR